MAYSIAGIDVHKKKLAVVVADVGVSEGERAFLGVRQAAAAVKAFREELGLPLFLNADHTHSLENAEAAARTGFDEIIFDRSELPIDENAKQTRRAVEAIKSIDPAILVEGEIGYIGTSSEILDTVHRATALTRQLLAFRMRQPPREVPVDVGDVVRELLPLLRRQCGVAIEVATRIEPGLPRIAGDPTQIEQVVLNLALNARDAMPDGGCLTIRVERAQSERPALLLAVADNGTGMDEEVRRRLFEPFFTTKPANGTGLGLSIVHDVVERCGGTIEVESAKGRGSEFRVLVC